MSNDETVPEVVGEEIRRSLASKDVGAANLSTVDSEANACIMRVLARRGLGPYRYAFVWPVMTVEILPGEAGAKKFIYDVRDLVRDK